MKTKRTLIISSAILALVIVVTIVSASAAWFGDIKHAETTLHVTSERPLGEATIDLTSAESLNDNTTKLISAKAVNGALLGGQTPPTGATLLTASQPLGIATAANEVPIYFPFSYSGSGDSGATDGKKAVKIFIDSAYLRSDLNYNESQKKYTPKEGAINYLDEFYITFDVVKDVQKEEGNITYTTVTSATATKSGETVTFSGLSSTNDSIYFKNDVDGKALYLLVPPSIDYYSVKVGISYNFIDEELNPATINQTIVFGIKILVIERDTLITNIKPLLP